MKTTEKDHPYYNQIIIYLLRDEQERKEQPEYIKKEEIRDWIKSLLNKSNQ